MNQFKTKILLFLVRWAYDVTRDFERFLNKKQKAIVGACNHDYKKPYFYETMRYEMTAGYRCETCGEVIAKTPTLEEKAALYKDFFWEDVVEENKIWQSLKNNNGFNL